MRTVSFREGSQPEFFWLVSKWERFNIASKLKIYKTSNSSYNIKQWIKWLNVCYYSTRFLLDLFGFCLASGFDCQLCFTHEFGVVFWRDGRKQCIFLGDIEEQGWGKVFQQAFPVGSMGLVYLGTFSQFLWSYTTHRHCVFGWMVIWTQWLSGIVFEIHDLGN